MLFYTQVNQLCEGQPEKRLGNPCIPVPRQLTLCTLALLVHAYASVIPPFHCQQQLIILGLGAHEFSRLMRKSRLVCNLIAIKVL